MSFLFPLTLAGIAAVSLPVVIHLLNKFRVRTVHWGAMRLLAETVKQNQRRVKLDDLLLLLLRCALIALAVLAFARPVLEGFATGGDASGPVAAVILLDHSPSMSRTDGSATVFERAKSEIREWLDGQDRSSQVALYLASRRTVPLLPRPVNDFALFRTSLDEAAPGSYGGDLSIALRQAVEALATVSGQRKEIRIYTDGQASSFANRDELAALARENPDISIVPIIIGSPAEDNLGLVGLRPEGGVASLGQAVRFRADVLNSSTSVKRDLAVNFTLGDGTPAGSAIIPSIAPGEVGGVSIAVSFPSPGPHAITAEIPADSFPGDNRISAAVDVISRMDVILTAPEFEPEGMESAVFYLSRALTPVPREQLPRYFLAPERVRLDGLAARLAQPEETPPAAVFLSDPGAVPEEVAAALAGYVESGGNLVVIPGNRGIDGWGGDSGFGALLPATVAPARVLEAGVAAARWQSDGFIHPVTDLWNDPANGDLSTVRFSRYHPLSLKPASGSASPEGARAIVSFSDGQPAIAEWNYGEGTVVLFPANFDREWTNLPLHPSFVPFLQRLIGYFNRAHESRLILQPGELFRKAVDEIHIGREFAVKPPDAATPRTVGPVNGESDGTYLRYSATDIPGLYEASIGEETVAVFAVQPDPRESDFRRVAAADLENLTDVPRSSPDVEAPRVVLKEFWTLFIWCVVAFFLIEAAVAHGISHARHA